MVSLRDEWNQRATQKPAVLKVGNYKPFKIVPYREIQRGSVHPDDEG